MIPPIPTTRPPQSGDRTDPLWEASRALEASFLSQMLSAAGLGTTPEGFGGGIGEDQFASLLRDEQAKAMTGSDGLGLAESIFRSLAARSPHA